GEFVQELYDISLSFRGSSNQRIIDVKKSLETGQITPYILTSRNL
ncbi:MAG: anaerobic ribonucleoside-triphosphate reductase activating protein, partial [Ruminococcus sp.]|nr:anaerobic ribonucleoside-triphosphate reductase activating protein [Ruminococcus sp.]